MVNSHNASGYGTDNELDEEDDSPNVGNNLTDVEDNLNGEALDVDATASAKINHVDNFVGSFVTEINELNGEFDNDEIIIESGVFEKNGNSKVTSVRRK